MGHLAPRRQGARQVHPHRRVADQHEARLDGVEGGLESRAPALRIEVAELAGAHRHHPVGGAELLDHGVVAADEGHRDPAAGVTGQPPAETDELEGDVGQLALEVLRHDQDVGAHHSTPFASRTASSSSAPSSICAPAPVSGGRISTTVTPEPLPAAALRVSRVADSCTWRTFETGA